MIFCDLNLYILKVIKLRLSLCFCLLSSSYSCFVVIVLVLLCLFLFSYACACSLVLVLLLFSNAMIAHSSVLYHINYQSLVFPSCSPAMFYPAVCYPATFCPAFLPLCLVILCAESESSSVRTRARSAQTHRFQH